MKSSLLSFFWLASEKVIRMFTGVFVGIWLARYLGPEQYGVYMYAIAWVGLFNAIAWFGVGDNLIRNLVSKSCDENELLGAAFLIRLVGSIIAGFLSIATIFITNKSDPLLVYLVILMSLAIPFSETPSGIFLYFQSKLQIAKPVLLQNMVRISSALLRIVFILAGCSLIWFGLAILVEAIGVFLVIFGLYWQGGGRTRDWVYNLSSVRLMLLQGTPIAIAALIASLSARMDQLMLGWFTDFSQVGIYGAALRFSEIWWSFAPVIMNSLSPKYIFNIVDDEKLKHNISKIMGLLLLLALLPVVIIFSLGQYAIPLLLGTQYATALPVLYIHIFMAILIYFDAPISQYLLAKNRQGQMIWKSVFLLSINGLLNYIFIPLWGAMGAALATLLSYLMTLILFYRIFSAYRDLALLQRNAIFLMYEMVCRRKVDL